MGCGASKASPAEPAGAGASAAPWAPGGDGSASGAAGDKAPPRKSMAQLAEEGMHQRAASSVGLKRREAVSAEKEEDAEAGWRPPVYPKDDGTKAAIKEAIRINPLFEGLGAEQLEVVIDAMSEQPVELHTEVIREGDEQGDTCYVVGSGKFAAYKGKTQLVSYGAGELFGELAVMYGCKRNASVACEEAGTLWALDRKTFKNILKGTYNETHNSAGEYLKTVPMLAELTDDQRARITEALTAEKYADGQFVIRHGEIAERLYIIKAGLVVATKDDGKELGTMGQGEFFGESALDGNKEPRKANVVARGEVDLLSISAEDFTRILGSLTELLQFNLNRRIIDGIELLSYLSRTQRSDVVEALKTERVPAGTVLLQQGSPGVSFYIIKSGECVVSQRSGEGGKPVELATLETSGYFGERSLLKDEPCNATVTAKSECVLMRLGRAEFTALLGANLQTIIDDEIRAREELAASAQAASITFADLELMTVLGEGSFGRVKLVRHTPTGRALALKCLRKGQLIKYKQVEHVVGEKGVMVQCKHPFVLRLEATFQSRYEVYMLLELCLGGELFSLLRLTGRLEEPHARFYAATVVSAFGYLHERYICHRDLKPENLLFDKQGYLKLVDMGFAKVVKDRTWTLCGTPEYLAPEIIGNKGHNHSADWWTLGVLLFEMTAGYPPFAGQDQMETYQKIMRGKVKYPPGMTAECRDCIGRLLAHNPTQRLGCLRGGARDVKTHDFFKPIDFRKLEARQLPPPFVPKVKDEFDTSNYDKYPDDAHDAQYWQRYVDPRYDPVWEKNFGKVIDVSSASTAKK